MMPLTNVGNDGKRVSMHRVVTLNTLCSIASIYFATQHNRFFSEHDCMCIVFLRGKQCTFELMNYFIFRKVLSNVFSGEVDKLTIY